MSRLLVHCRLLIVVVLLLACASCGGGGGGGTQVELNPAPRQPANFDLNVMEETFLNGPSAGEFSRSIRHEDGEVVVEVNVSEAENLRALYFTVAYDHEKYTPVELATEEVIGYGDNVLRLDVLSDLGLVHSGQVLTQWDEQAGFSGDALLATLRFSEQPATSLRRASVAPKSPDAAVGLTYDSAAGVFRWKFNNPGDYDQNGETNISDLSALGKHFLEIGDFLFDSALSVIDGDHNGELNIADLTTIGSNFGNSITDWMLFWSMDPSDHPPEPGASNGAGATLQASIPFNTGLGDPATQRLQFSYDPAGGRLPSPGEHFWVRPADATGDLGTSSNMVQIPGPGSVLIEQIDYDVDGTTQQDSMFGSVQVFYDPADGLQYLNVVVDGEWVIENVPLLPYGEPGTLSGATLGISFSGMAGDDVLVVDAASMVTSVEQLTPPTGATPTTVKKRVVKVNKGKPAAIQPGNPKNEFGDQVVDFAAHSGKFPNQDCGANECVPAAVSNSLQWLQGEYGTPVVTDDVSIGEMKDATEWSAGGCDADWADQKDAYMILWDYGITTELFPNPAVSGHEATTAECQSALDAIKAGKDVELDGAGHVAAVVGMAKLKDGRFVIYVAHDTKQGTEGGQRVEKVIYDPTKASPVAEGGWGFNGGKINGFVAESPDDLISLPDFDLFQADHSLDGVLVVDSEFGIVELTFTPVEDVPQYFNMTVDGVWVIENIPVLPIEVGVEQTVSMQFPLAVEPGTDVNSALVGAELSIAPTMVSPPQNIPLGILTASVLIGTGTGALEALVAGSAANEVGGTVDGNNWAVHSAAMPNQEAKSNGCVPAAVSNSLQFLKATNPVTMAGVADADIDIGSAETMTGYDATGVPYGWDGTQWELVWPNRKAKHMSDNSIPVTTTMIPATQPYTSNASAANCDAAIQALKDGKDVELNGANHCAVLVGMAKLTNGKYVMYVAHDTNQGNAGGQKVEKVIYDPAAATPAAEGGWGFNGKRITGFTVEEPSETLIDWFNIEQTSFTLEGITTSDTGWGELTLTYEPITTSDVNYLNFSYNGEWVAQDVPIRGGGNPGEEVSTILRFDLGIEDGNLIEGCRYGVSITENMAGVQPLEGLGLIEPNEFVMDSGEDGETIVYGSSITDALWWINTGYTDAAFHPWSSIVNQECGLGECAPAAVSNSLKMLKAANSTAMSGLSDADISIGTMGGATGFTGTGSPAGTPDSAGAWWNKKKTWMNDDNKYPIKTEIVKDKSKMDDIMQAIKDGKDVELRVKGHVAMITGIVKLADGTYILEVAHDTKQGQDGGTIIELVKFDPTTGKFTGGTWIDGKDFTDGATNGALFVVESVSTVNVTQTDYNLNGTAVATDSGWGEATVTHTPDGTGFEYLNMSVEGIWVVENLPLPLSAIPGESQDLTFRYDLGVADGTPVHEISYGFEIGATPLLSAPVEDELGLIDDSFYNMSDGEITGSLLYGPPAGPILWHPFPIVDWAFHSGANIVNQDCGENECAPTAISNSLKMLENASGTFAGPGVSIDDMKPATGWTPDGAPASTPGDPGAWWNLKKEFMDSNWMYSVSTKIIGESADFGDVMDALKAGQDVELRVPGHVVMVTGAIQLANGDYILWVAHDTDQDNDGGTVIEPVYYDSATGTFSGPPWIDGVEFATGGGAGALFVVEDLVPDPSWYLNLLDLVPDPSVPGIIPDGFSGLAPLYDTETLLAVGTVPFQFYDPTGIPTFEHISWNFGSGGAPVLIFDTLTAGAPCGLQIHMESVNLDEPSGYGGVRGCVVGYRQTFTELPSGETGHIGMYDLGMVPLELRSVPQHDAVPPDPPVEEGVFSVDSFFDVYFEIQVEPLGVSLIENLSIIDP